LGVLNDDLNLFITSFFVLGLAGLEFSVGLFLIVFFRNINKTLLLNDTNKTINDFTQSNNNLFYINRFL
jgi:NADH:ubiquinone oxidoreductase subunit K